MISALAALVTSALLILVAVTAYGLFAPFVFDYRLVDNELQLRVLRAFIVWRWEIQRSSTIEVVRLWPAVVRSITRPFDTISLGNRIAVEVLIFTPSPRSRGIIMTPRDPRNFKAALEQARGQSILQ